MLIFIGLGLSIDNIPLGNLKKLMKCDRVVIDSYTSVWFPSIEILAEVLSGYGKDVVIASREYLEGESIAKIVSESKERNLCIATPGDPFIATTHVAILVEALKQNIGIEIAPSSSILNVGISISCLQAYRFGKIVTVVKPKNGIAYEYPLDILKMNRELGLHTLMLLEIDVERGYYMSPREALEILLDIQKKREEKILDLNDRIIVLESILGKEHRVYIDTVENIVKNHPKNIDRKVCSLIVPAKKLHPLEEECINNINKVVYMQNISIDDLHRVLKIFNKT